MSGLSSKTNVKHSKSMRKTRTKSRWLSLRGWRRFATVLIIVYFGIVYALPRLVDENQLCQRFEAWGAAKTDNSADVTIERMDFSMNLLSRVKAQLWAVQLTGPNPDFTNPVLEIPALMFYLPVWNLFGASTPITALTRNTHLRLERLADHRWNYENLHLIPDNHEMPPFPLGIFQPEILEIDATDLKFSLCDLESGRGLTLQFPHSVWTLSSDNESKNIRLSGLAKSGDIFLIDPDNLTSDSTFGSASMALQITPVQPRHNLRGEIALTGDVPLSAFTALVPELRTSQLAVRSLSLSWRDNLESNTPDTTEIQIAGELDQVNLPALRVTEPLSWSFTWNKLPWPPPQLKIAKSTGQSAEAMDLETGAKITPPRPLPTASLRIALQNNSLRIGSDKNQVPAADTLLWELYSPPHASAEQREIVQVANLDLQTILCSGKLSFESAEDPNLALTRWLLQPKSMLYPWLYDYGKRLLTTSPRPASVGALRGDIQIFSPQTWWGEVYLSTAEIRQQLDGSAYEITAGYIDNANQVNFSKPQAKLKITATGGYYWSGLPQYMDGHLEANASDFAALWSYLPPAFFLPVPTSKDITTTSDNLPNNVNSTNKNAFSIVWTVQRQEGQASVEWKNPDHWIISQLGLVFRECLEIPRYLSGVEFSRIESLRLPSKHEETVAWNNDLQCRPKRLKMDISWQQSDKTGERPLIKIHSFELDVGYAGQAKAVERTDGVAGWQVTVRAIDDSWLMSNPTLSKELRELVSSEAKDEGIIFDIEDATGGVLVARSYLEDIYRKWVVKTGTTQPKTK